MGVYQENLCERWTGKSNLTCLLENLIFVEKLPEVGKSEPNYTIENFLKACRLCGQVYKVKIYKYEIGSDTNLFYKITGNLVNQCHCIGYLNEVEILLEKSICEDDPMYFAMEKETKMRCGKCGKLYIESIYQNNFDAVYYQNYSEFKS